MATNTRKLAALLGSSGANIADAGTINTAGITNDAINASKIVANAVGTSEVADNVLTATDLAANSVGESELSVDYTTVKPHIIPGVLQPAIGGKLLNGADHSGAYGTAQTQSGGDGHSYYYTDIKGSKPIKDPRIGGHFGSQRHKLKSFQLLEQETATHGDDVYSIDGREWCRAVGSKWSIRNDDYGHTVALNGQNVYNITTQFIEVVGYFNQANLSAFTNHDAPNTIDCLIDGTDTGSNGSFETSVASPIAPSRYVDGTSLINLPLGSTTLGLHTLRISVSNSENISIYFLCGNLELIAQDTASTARRSEIKIPKQNVVSYGKKFEVGSDDLDNAVHPHYDPFNGMSGAKTLAQLGDYIDTGTSLLMETWKGGTANYYKPFNGGRVIKWVDSSGTIKTSVTMMPPNAQNISSTGSNPFSDGEIQAGTNDHTITFNTSPASGSTGHEVAKLWHAREFGNGNANGGHLGTYKDVSMVDSADNRDIAFVMDDGLTGLSGAGVNWVNGLKLNDSTANIYITFIGTGISLKFDTSTNSGVFGGTDHYEIHIDGIEIEDYTNGDSVSGNLDVYAQNLPYGTHILRLERIAANTTGLELLEVAIHQPKKPPIPEDACILSDFMLMADHVIQGSAGPEYISKGVRSVDASRDALYDQSGAFSNTARYVNNVATGLTITWAAPGSATSKTELPAFCTNQVHVGYNINERYQTYAIDSGSGYSNVTPTAKTGTGMGSFYNNTGNAHALGVAKHKTHGAFATSSGWSDRIDVVSPIHTSHHYQSFETPFQHELIGGDRNMEQTNLICSPDGKTWDEVTRDTNYLNNLVISGSRDGGNVTNGIFIFDWWRGDFEDSRNTAVQKKHWAIAYDRLICLIEGTYEINVMLYSNANDTALYVNKNDASDSSAGKTLGYTRADLSDCTVGLVASNYFKRGDHVAVRVAGTGRGDQTYANHIQIKKV